MAILTGVLASVRSRRAPSPLTVETPGRAKRTAGPAGGANSFATRVNLTRAGDTDGLAAALRGILRAGHAHTVETLFAGFTAACALAPQRTPGR
jgi:hypothetical protein